MSGAGVAGSPVRAYVGVGANLGDALASVQAAVAALGGLPGTSLAGASSLYRSAPVDATGPDFINAVAAVDTWLAPEGLLDELQALELRFGRERPYRNAPRTLDLDLLLFGEQRWHSERLTVPHPRLPERAFVLLPLLELAPGLCLPGGVALASLLPAVQQQAITRLAA